MKRDYYLERTGALIMTSDLSFQMLKKAFKIEYNKLNSEGYFQAAFGFTCDYNNDTIYGTLGYEIGEQMFLSIGRENLWPIRESLDTYDQGELFAVIEFLYDHCAKPSKTTQHDYCLHVETSDSSLGKQEFRNRFNPHLKKYANVELSVKGEILNLPEQGFDKLFTTPLRTSDKKNISDRIEVATIKFRKANGTVDSRREALRDLADVLEYIKKDVKEVLMNKEEKELFQIANNFGIRHHNQKQKTEYDQAAWHAWMFYCYLSTIHLCLHLKDKQNQK